MSFCFPVIRLTLLFWVTGKSFRGSYFLVVANSHMATISCAIVYNVLIERQKCFRNVDSITLFSHHISQSIKLAICQTRGLLVIFPILHLLRSSWFALFRYPRRSFNSQSEIDGSRNIIECYHERKQFLVESVGKTATSKKEFRETSRNHEFDSKVFNSGRLNPRGFTRVFIPHEFHKSRNNDFKQSDFIAWIQE
jgi:hypothetical protein